MENGTPSFIPNVWKTSCARAFGHEAIAEETFSRKAAKSLCNVPQFLSKTRSCINHSMRRAHRWRGESVCVEHSSLASDIADVLMECDLKSSLYEEQFPVPGEGQARVRQENCWLGILSLCGTDGQRSLLGLGHTPACAPQTTTYVFKVYASIPWLLISRVPWSRCSGL